ncbi:hypothetical protein BD310DRAFT_196241 [Dichomitus squalens]|uniref:Uncharacterized protein n=1 Tax=Dichomitus squalens TaxID=114155 RepID=A0A4Q9Q311_9APHY|nr:hypothetical protein BD310DRAFT_196241 [Dichomitus squalens]
MMVRRTRFLPPPLRFCDRVKAMEWMPVATAGTHDLRHRVSCMCARGSYGRRFAPGRPGRVCHGPHVRRRHADVMLSLDCLMRWLSLNAGQGA